jgi:hypothetical protein
LSDADLGGEMHHAVDTLQRAGDHILVADVADYELGTVGKVVRPLAIAVHLLDQTVEYPNLIPAAKKLLGNRASNESCATG